MVEAVDIHLHLEIQQALIMLVVLEEAGVADLTVTVTEEPEYLVRVIMEEVDTTVLHSTVAVVAVLEEHTAKTQLLAQMELEDPL